jgi:nucleoside-triphosphatase THEP1
MLSSAARIAAVVGDESGNAQAVLAAMVADWRASGARIVGLIGESHGLSDRTCGAGFLRDIATGKAYSIYRETPPSDTACHLDADGVARACTAVFDRMAESDLVVLNKYGKLEAMQQGLAAAFEAAVSAGKPLLTTVSDRYRAAWCAFAPDATCLAANQAELQEWWRALSLPPRHAGRGSRAFGTS